MTDRELLEMSAKAADIKIWFSDAWYDVGECLTGTIAHNSYWNPLEDDGDAFRLAVKLRLHVEWQVDGRVAVSPQNETLEIYSMESSRENSQENTRRAIVRAAAEIGKDMK